MQDDLTWGVKALVADGTVDPKRVGIVGVSYGGYATLAGVAFTPDLYTVAVDIVGPSNLVTELNLLPAYWEAGKQAMYTRVADPKTEEGKALLIAESPLTRANAIVTPLMVVQGKNDPRVNIRESNQICRRRARQWKACRISRRPRRGPRLCPAHQQSCNGVGNGTLSGKVSRRPLRMFRPTSRPS